MQQDLIQLLVYINHQNKIYLNRLAYALLHIKLQPDIIAALHKCYSKIYCTKYMAKSLLVVHKFQ